MRRRPRPRSCWRAGRPHHRAGAGRRAVAPVGEPRREAGRRLHQDGCTAIVPPLLGSVAAEGEWALVSFDGAWSHAANKRIELPHAAAIEGLLAPEATAPHVADADQLAVGGAAVEHVVSRFGTPTPARVDLARGDDGTPSRLGSALAA